MQKNRKNSFDFDLELGKLYAIWLREFKVFLREKSRLVASTFTPLLWLFVLGGGLGSTVSTPFHTPNIDYQKFIFPGIVIMSVIFSSVFFGAYIIWDRKFDFLKSVMVAPVRRSTIFLGKTFGGMTTSLIQAFILLAIGVIIGINYTPSSILSFIVIVLLLSFALTSLGLAIGSYMESLEGFQLIISFVVFPLYFLSGALFPLDNIPIWLSILTSINPATYAVEALRSAILGVPGKNLFIVNIGVLLITTIALGIAGVLSFRRMKAV
ncbi:MAG: ABC transporter permease [Thermoproteota archaeon]|nr:ABC transporter permease [Thermoproteota archaeon]